MRLLSTFWFFQWAIDLLMRTRLCSEQHKNFGAFAKCYFSQSYWAQLNLFSFVAFLRWVCSYSLWSSESLKYITPANHIRNNQCSEPIKSRSKRAVDARKRARASLVTIGFGCTFNWLRKWHEIFKPITELRNVQPIKEEFLPSHHVKISQKQRLWFAPDLD